ncbi:MAG: serine protein kinase PrkA [Polyangiaceae bacterium]|nr:serine protein kinase PrkA [Polyangiaceae bacterium]
MAEGVQHKFTEDRRVLAYGEYLELVAAHPHRHSRGAARYVRDLFEHYGRAEVERPWGRSTRHLLFDLPFLPPEEARREALVAQEEIQEEIGRCLENFVREGRINRVVLLHGPNGSAKSTVAACIFRALEHYSTLDDGALYRFHWVFPNTTQLRGAIGFGERREGRSAGSYAHLPDDQLDARLHMEVRDHPLFLLPAAERAEWLRAACEAVGSREPLGRFVLKGELSHKNRQIFDALLASYDGDLARVLDHVQVERWFVSRRYRRGAVTLGPELSVDAGERQVTQDRSLGALPASLQSLALFEAHGELVDAMGGVLEFSDLLKRPIDAFKYLQITAETGEVSLRSQNLPVDAVMLASANEVHLAALREHPEFDSFRGRLELVRAPYLLRHPDEEAIYAGQIASQVGGRVAPHATRVAALFAVLTRLRRPRPERFEGRTMQLVRELTPMEKLDLYADGTPPARLDEEARKLLRSAVPALRRDGADQDPYEGSVGASPRELRTVLLDAAQSARFSALSPLAVLEALDDLCERRTEYGWLAEGAEPGGWYDHAYFRRALRERLEDDLERELRSASGLVDEARHLELFERYVLHVSYWVKGEKLRNPLTGQLDDPDATLMRDIEALLGTPDGAEALRHSLIGRVAAWAIDRPGEPIDNRRIFATQIEALRGALYREQRGALARMCRAAVVLVREGGVGLDEDQRRGARRLLDALCARFGYDEPSAVDAAVVLVRGRFADLLG